MTAKEQYHNAKRVFLLSENANRFSDKGLQFVKDMLIKKFDEHSILKFYEGQILNKPETLAHFLEDYRDEAYLVVYTDENVWCANPPCFEAIIMWLRARRDDNSWTVILDNMKRLLPEEFTDTQKS